jgi:hypothetical protein
MVYWEIFHIYGRWHEGLHICVELIGFYWFSFFFLSSGYTSLPIFKGSLLIVLDYNYPFIRGLQGQI